MLTATVTAPLVVVRMVGAEITGWLSCAFFLPKCSPSVAAWPLAFSSTFSPSTLADA